MLLGKRIRTQDGSDTDYQVIPSPFQAGGSPFTPQDSLSSTSCAIKLPGLMLAGGEEEVVVEEDVHRGLPQAGSHFPSNSITDFPSERAAQRAAKQLLVHLFTSLPSFPRLPKVPPKAVPNHQEGGGHLALFRRSSAVAPVQASVTRLIV